MVIGHYAAAFALKRIEPRLSLGTLIFGANMLDILIALTLFAGIEHARYLPGSTLVYPVDFYDYPVTHGMAGAFLWSVLGFSAYWFWSAAREASRAWLAFVFGLSIFSHYVLDVTTHIKMPLLGNDSLKIGLALYDNLPADVTLESGLLAAAVALYAASTTSEKPSGHVSLAVMIAILLLVWIWSLVDLRLEYVYGGLPDLLGMMILLFAGNLLGVAMGFWVEAKRTTRENVVDEKEREAVCVEQSLE